MLKVKSQKSTAGFTLIETIMAVVVIALIITAVAELTQSSLRAARTTMQDFRASQHAEEGLEIIRNIRDSNWMRNISWKSGLEAGTYILNDTPPWTARQVDALTATAAATSSAQPAKEFTRLITISYNDTGAMVVKSDVSFERRGGKRTITLMSELTDWKKGPL